MFQKQKERNMITIVGFTRETFGRLIPKLVIHKIMVFFYHENANIFDWKEQKMHRNFTKVYINSHGLFLIHDSNELWLNDSAQTTVNKHVKRHNYLIKNIYFMDERTPNTISNGLSNNHCFVYTIKGELYGFGYNYRQQIIKGDNSFVEPTLIKYDFDSRIIQIECGFQHSLFLTSNGNVYGSGDNDCYQLSSNHSSDNQYDISKIYDKRDIIRIRCALRASCLLTKNGTLLCVGSLAKTQNKMDKLVGIDSDIRVKTFDCGGYHAGCVTSDNLVYTFGDNKYGQLGVNSTQGYIEKPTKVNVKKKSKDKIVNVRCGSNYTIIKTTNNYYTFGYKTYLNEHSWTFIRKPILLDVSYIKAQTGLNGDIIDIIPAYFTSLILQKK